MEAETEWSDLLGLSASVWTILQMLSPLPTCYYFIKKQSVGDMIVTPYIVALTSCSLWFLYGYIIENKTIVKVNLIGASLQFFYSLCYYTYCSKKVQVRKYFAIVSGVIIASVIYIKVETDLDRLESVFGLLCSCVTVLFFASPLANIHYVIKVWNSESLPALLIVTSFVVSVQWGLYGYIIEDNYILSFPNWEAGKLARIYKKAYTQLIQYVRQWFPKFWGGTKTS